MGQPWWWVDRRLRCKEILVVAMASTFASLALSAAGFSTNEWSVVTVDRVRLKTLAIETKDTAYLVTIHSDYNYFSRKRGLFMTCFPDNNETEFLKSEEFYKSGKCLHEPALKLSVPKSSWGSDYRKRNDMMRTHLALLAIGLGCLFIALLSGLATYCALNTGILLLSSACSLLSFFASFIGMIVFHIYDDNEIHELDYKPFEAYWSKDTVLKDNSSVKYGFSFYMAWAGTALCLVATVLFWGAYFTWKEHTTKPTSTSSKRVYYDIDIYGRRRKSDRWRRLSPPSENLSHYYLYSRDPSYNGTDRRSYPFYSRQVPPYYKPYDYYDYHNIYGGGGVYPY